MEETLPKAEVSLELNFLDPKKIKLFRAKGDILRMTLENDRSYLKVLVTCAFPLSDPRHYISFRDGLNNEIGLIKDLRDLDGPNRRLVEEELKKRYFRPIIRKIKSLKEEFGLFYWEVETDKGPKEFVVREMHDNVIPIGPRRLLVLDVEGNRFEIPDYSRLDPRSLSLINRLL